MFSGGVTASTDTHVALARVDPQVALPEYVFRYLLSAVGQRELRSRERGDWTQDKVGFRLTELNLRDLEQVPVPVVPLDEQRQILDRLARWDADASSLARRYATQASVLQAVISKVVEGAAAGIAA